MTKLIAERPVFYAGRTRRKGEVFEATAADAKLLLLTRQVKAQETEVDTEPAVELVAKPRRQYRRRDMRAEG